MRIASSYTGLSWLSFRKWSGLSTPLCFLGILTIAPVQSHKRQIGLWRLCNITNG
jgi:hypothetical protein